MGPLELLFERDNVPMHKMDTVSPKADSISKELMAILSLTLFQFLLSFWVKECGLFISLFPA